MDIEAVRARQIIAPSARCDAPTWLTLSSDAQLRLIEAARSKSPVAGLTHNYYRYPARFSPVLVGEAIEVFSQPGDVVLDPFMGGGTTLVEAAARGRRAVGNDISTLATFVARAKTAILEDAARTLASQWLDALPRQINMKAPEPKFTSWSDAGYFKHLDSRQRWRLRKALAQCVEAAEQIGNAEAETFARCVILRTAQWALDGRKGFPSLDSFKDRLQSYGSEMLISSGNFARAISEQNGTVACLNRSVIGLEKEALFREQGAPRLILTSPPYPGVHVLYHRWQVSGGKETGTPFFIANALDGSGSSYYTMGDRKRPGLTSYFTQLRGGLTSLASLSDESTVFVQVVAFSQPEWQLPAYLNVASEAGLDELVLPLLGSDGDGRLWREVPNRKWYADQKGRTPGAKEVVLFHRLTAG